jgi:hypothetical protein
MILSKLTASGLMLNGIRGTFIGVRIRRDALGGDYCSLNLKNRAASLPSTVTRKKPFIVAGAFVTAAQTIGGLRRVVDSKTKFVAYSGHWTATSEPEALTLSAGTSVKVKVNVFVVLMNRPGPVLVGTTKRSRCMLSVWVAPAGSTPSRSYAHVHPGFAASSAP